jgi:viroplasmin and RNaseH domain-containing protein
MKFYAVKNGRVPGVYTTWDECKKQTNGFSNACFKSFDNLKDAENFVSVTTPTAPIAAAPIAAPVSAETVETMHIYTDGSFTESYSGIGAYCNYLGKEYKMSKECTKELLSYYSVTGSFRNPTVEFISFAEVCKNVCNLNVHIVFHVDYIGIKNWIENNWQTKEQNISNIKKLCKLPKSYEILHVKGHSGVYGNEMADKLASSMTYVNDFEQFNLQ